MIGLLPASGRAVRMKGIPKFLLPSPSGDLLLEYHVKLLRPFVDEVRICTNARWFDLVTELELDAEIVEIAPSTMNAAVLDMYGSNNLIGMPDTFFTGSENPYERLADSYQPVGVALWHCDDHLRGKVGQVDYRNDLILDVQDKDPECDYGHMWGALRLSFDAIEMLNPNDAHPGINLGSILESLPYSASEMSGRYIDCGTVDGLREMLNSGRLA